jgi:hypothetical protein
MAEVVDAIVVEVRKGFDIEKLSPRLRRLLSLERERKDMRRG